MIMIRYADDLIVGFQHETDARSFWDDMRERLRAFSLPLHPDKTRIVYCKDANRRGSHEHESFTFLGFTFRPRGARRGDGIMFLSFSPAVSKDALKKMSATVRAWRLHRRTGFSDHDLARIINPVVRGWMQY